MPTERFDARLAALLKSHSEFVDDTGELLRDGIKHYAWDFDRDLISLLLSDEEVESKFFEQVNGRWIFNNNTFVNYINDKNFLADSYTQFRNKIGLNIDNKFLRERGEVALVWPYKDCVLEGGQRHEDEKRQEIFFSELLAQDEINRMFDAKVFTNWKRYTDDGEANVVGVQRDETRTICENLLIKGNNLIALHCLKQQFRGQAKLIYIDPPYNTGSDSFGYNNNFNHAAWLTFEKNRLEVAKHFLSNSGSIWISIDERECAYLKVLCDEVFGRENHISTVTVKVKDPAGVGQQAPIFDICEYLLAYAKDIKQFKESLPEFVDTSPFTEKAKGYKNLIVKYGEPQFVSEIERQNVGSVKIYKCEDYEISNANELSFDEYVEKRDSIAADYNPSGGMIVAIREQIPARGLSFIEYTPTKGKMAGRQTRVYFLNRRILSYLSDILIETQTGVYRKSKLTNLWDIPNASLHLEGLNGYEYRPQQLEMAKAVADAFRADEHLIVEAGTGVGKTFAYLIPAIDLALSAGETVVISTNTISLQEQLIKKDIPFLQKILPFSFTAVLAKGRSNYLSRRRLNSLLTYERGLFDTKEEVVELAGIVEWVAATDDGSRADLEKQPMPEIWDQVVSDRDNCLRSKCPTYDTCFYFKARRQMQEANLLIVNHHLLFSDLEIRRSADVQSAVLPDYQYLILDEAHHLEAIAGKHATVEFTNSRVKRFLDSLNNPSGKSGLSVRYAASHLKESVEDARNQANKFFSAISDWLETQGSQRWGGSITQRIDRENFVENVLDAPLATLQAELKDLGETAQTDDDKEEITSHLRRCGNLREDLDLMISHSDPDSVYWIETLKRGRFARMTLNATPVNVSEAVNEYLFDSMNSVILTSATLATNQNFDFFRKRLGLSECRELIAGSPFDYRRQVEIHIPANMPDPRRSIEYTQSIITQVKRYLKMTNGKAFVLFTS